MTKYADDYYREYLERFKDYSDIDIITSFNREVGNLGWGTARQGYLSALRYEFKRREIDISSISTDKAISYRKRVALYVTEGNKFVLPVN